MDKEMEYVKSYTYLEVVFSGPTFSMRGAMDTKLRRGYATLGGLETMCSQEYFKSLVLSYGYLIFW